MPLNKKMIFLQLEKLFDYLGFKKINAAPTHLLVLSNKKFNPKYLPLNKVKFIT